MFADAIFVNNIAPSGPLVSPISRSHFDKLYLVVAVTRRFGAYTSFIEVKTHSGPKYCTRAPILDKESMRSDVTS
jgi:hypothetical protein